MADRDHVDAVVDPEAELNPVIGNGTEPVDGAGPETGTSSPPRRTDNREGSQPASELPHDRDKERGAPSESDPNVDETSVLQPRVRFPLNSRRLTAWHLRALARALGIPTMGSTDQLRQ